MTKTPCPDCPNNPVGEAELHSLRECLALELARANALQDTLDKEREKVALTVAVEVRAGKAEALREAADFWQDTADHNTPADIEPDWLRERATEYERESEHGVGRWLIP